MPNLGPTELIIILVIVLAIFGAGKLSSLGGALGRGIKDFKTAVQDDEEEASEAAPEAAEVKEETPSES